MTAKTHTLRGYLYIASATFCWGISASLGRAAFTGRLLSGKALPPIDALILAQCRTTLSLLIIFPVLLTLRGWRGVRLPRAAVARMFILGIFGLAVSNYFYYLAIQKSNVATAITVQYTAPVWVLIYMVVRGVQKATLQRVVAVFIAVFGIALVIGAFGPGRLQLNAMGVVAALLAAFSYAFYNVYGHSQLREHDHWTVMLYTTLAASTVWIVINPPWKIAAAHYSGAQWLFLLVFAITSMLAPFSFYFAGLKYLEPTRAIVVSCLEPVFSVLIAALTLGEVLGPLQVAGIVSVLAAILIVQRGGAANQVVVEPIE